jgi:hypothetical protein
MGTNTGLGIGIGIPFKNNALGGDKPYFPPELKARMIGVWTNYGKKNTDADRNIIKNKIPNAGGDLEILNAAYKLNSGFGKYSEDFTTWTKSSKITSVDSESFDFVTNVNWNLLYYKSNIGKDIPSFKVHIKLKGEGKVFYNYITSEGVFTSKVITSEEYVVPISYNTKYTGETPVNCGFSIGITSEECSGTITQIPNFEDAFVSDGINDMIISQKTLQEMGVTKELTIVSMIHQISFRNSISVPLTNYIRPTDNIYARNQIADIGKTGIYGYVVYDIKNSTVENSHIVNTILGDKNDYSIYTIGDLSQGKFSVQGYIDGNGNIRETSSVAHYWTFAVLGKATEDEINLIIGNYNLDRSLKPDILCNIGKQGITNDNHADFNDKLVDYSGNGRDVQMNNLAWKGGSGIAAKPYETFKDWTSESSSTSIITQIDEFTRIVESTTNGYWVSRIRRNSDLNKVYDAINVYLYQDNNFLVHECKYEVDGIKHSIPINESVGKGYHKLEMYTKDRYTELPENAENIVLSEWYFPKSTKGSIKYSVIPSYKGGILLDGINDFGKVTGMPIYKDYTFIIDREIISIGNTVGIVASKSEDSKDVNKQGAFLFEYLSAPNNISAWSFYKDNGKVANTDFTRGISYQSKYSYNGIELLAGTALDSDKLWLGILRDRDSRFANVAIYSLMSFPYSMSKFLIERQLKKYKLGTLYPNMVEFRPVINSNVLLDSKPTFVIRGTSTYLNAGDYVPENSQIWVSIKMNNIADRITKFTVNGKTIDIPENAYNEVTLQYGFPFVIDKSPQKIGITIEQDENYVLFNPVITSNVEYHKLDFYLNNYQKRINIGDYIPKDVYLRANFYLKNNVDELTVFTFNGVNIGYRRSPYDDTAFNIGHIYNYDSPQEVNITIDEYIRYEEIVQPYPLLFEFTDENGNLISWGGKAKVGNTITRTKSVSNANILAGLYNTNNYKLNGKPLEGNSYVVEKSMVFTCTATWAFDNNEPKCILSPRLLRIPNSSYKILGHIPDISGHGNHGVIYNSAYTGMSGANGYPYDYNNSSFWSDSGLAKVVSGELVEYFAVKNSTGFSNITSGVYKGEIKVTGVTKAISENKISRLRIFTNSTTDKEIIDITQDGNYNIDIKGVGDANRVFFYAIPNNPNESIVVRLTEPIHIEQVGEYEGAYCLDGVDDFVTIPTTVGGKQVLMKVNWQNRTGLLYDQRKNGSSIDAFAILNVNSNNSIAYNSRNTDGETYIDGILNKNIVCPQLYKITHSITIINQLANKEEVISPTIGSDTTHKVYFSQMSLYDFMLFDNISTDDKIKELNEYVGIAAKVELPPYYWDTYGKTNSDADRDTIQQRGVAIGDYDLTNYNHAYEGMSGYNGYPVVFGIGKTYGGMPSTDDFAYTVSPTTVNVTKFNITHGFIYSYLKHNGELETQNSDYPSYKIKVTGLEKGFGLHYSYLKNPSDANLSAFGIGTDGTYTIPKSFASDGSLINNNVWIGFIFTGTAPESCNVTIEVLPEYENGLTYDGVSDFSDNKNIPIFTDFTAIIKRIDLDAKNNNSAVMFKGNKIYESSIGNGFILDYYYNSKNYVYSYSKINQIKRDDSKIIYLTPESYNGNPIIKGENGDNLGLILGKYWKGIIYKTILYSKTISLLEINFLKNLMEKDEIIDLTNPIFIKNE